MGELELTRGQEDQLTSIYANGPKWAGDLISKSATRELQVLGLVSYNRAWAVVTPAGIDYVEGMLRRQYQVRPVPFGFEKAFREHVRRVSKCILEERGWLKAAREEAEKAGCKHEHMEFYAGTFAVPAGTGNLCHMLNARCPDCGGQWAGDVTVGFQNEVEKRLERLVRFLRIDVRSVRNDRRVEDQLADLKMLILARADGFDPVQRKTCSHCEGLGKVPA